MLPLQLTTLTQHVTFQYISTDSIKFAVWNDGTGDPMIGGFGSFHVTPDYMTVTYHAANGTALFTTPRLMPRYKF